MVIVVWGCFCDLFGGFLGFVLYVCSEYVKGNWLGVVGEERDC